MSVSAVSGEGTRQLLGRAAQLLAQQPEEDAAALPVYRPESDPRIFDVRPEGDGWRVSGASLERAAAMTYWEYDQSVRRFQRILERLGVGEALKAEGVRAGDSVYIGEHELEWQE